MATHWASSNCCSLFLLKQNFIRVALELLFLVFRTTVVDRTGFRIDLTQPIRPVRLSHTFTHAIPLCNNMLKGSVDLLEDACTTEHNCPRNKYQQHHIDDEILVV